VKRSSGLARQVADGTLDSIPERRQTTGPEEVSSLMVGGPCLIASMNVEAGCSGPAQRRRRRRFPAVRFGRDRL